MFTSNSKIMREYLLEKKLRKTEKRDKIKLQDFVNKFPCREKPRED